MRKVLYIIAIASMMMWSCEEERSSDCNLDYIRVTDASGKLITQIEPTSAPSGSGYLYNSELEKVDVETNKVVLEVVTTAESVSSIKVYPRNLQSATKPSLEYSLDNLQDGNNWFYIVIESEDLLTAKRYSLNIVKEK